VQGNLSRGMGQFLGELPENPLNFRGYKTRPGNISGKITYQFFMGLRPTRNA